MTNIASRPAKNKQQQSQIPQQMGGVGESSSHQQQSWVTVSDDTVTGLFHSRNAARESGLGSVRKALVTLL